MNEETLTRLTPPPYFDGVAARHELTKHFNSSTSAVEARPKVIETLKRLVKIARESARTALEVDGNGRRCAAGLSEFQDELIRLIYDYTVVHVYRATNPSDAERMAIVATGGYGRGLLAPGSDIDLLFLLPYKQTPWGESVAEYMLYLLWDLGFKVGHATRTVEQCLKLGYSDITIRTSLLDSRLILGDKQLFSEFETRFRAEVVRGTARQFIDAKMAERDQRMRRSWESRYKVEPNIKDGKGGLRDLHTLQWLSKYIFGQDVGSAAVEAGIFTPEEVQTFRRCEDFLWRVRCFLHFMTGRPEEVLSFSVQPAMAQSLGYTDRGGMRAVERFMKHYFLVAKDVGDLTTILCGALEMQQLKSAPTYKKLLSPLNWKTRREIRQRTDFRVDNDRLNVADPDVFARDPVNLIRFFAQAASMGIYLHPSAIRLLRNSLRLIDDKLRADPEANQIFLSLLTAKGNPEASLRHMNEAGVLARFLPEFGRIVAMMQFNMYHHYTVDEHLLRTLGNVTAIERGDLAAELPLSTSVFRSIKNRRALLVAAFLHDIGKGRKESHSIVGARIARKVCPRLGMTAAETELVAWLIEEHLTMSNFAHSRDVSDPDTIRAFANIVQSPERLKLLLVLTSADIMAVGPGVWNGWKGQLLRTLYHETEPLVAGGHTQIPRDQRIDAALGALREALADWPKSDVDDFIARNYPNYWLRTDTATQVAHAHVVRDAIKSRTKLTTSVKTDAVTAITELTVFAPNHARLLSLFAGACAASGANIAGAHITTTRDGYALDTFLLNREFEDDADELRRAKRISDTIERLLEGRERLPVLLERRRANARGVEAFAVEPEIVINNELSERLTVIEVSGRDRPGLLYELTSALSDLSLDIASAHVTTFGEKAVDVFYVTDLTGKQIVSEVRQRTIRDRLQTILLDNDASVAPERIAQS
ncbi:(Protein-PII) uridylyltransferase (PII uridylyl-transferase) (Uridylyl-removing enzyme) (UTase) [Hyphomicrobium sp. GJ21]|uniref:[protein-PII] uridylyltransferase n=1 Tax=Hyphomicrobium sp. GJ21 TaxID=113574 RepID=UPI000622BE87|nr:[protein-PII] uridylyltransferase [Hyphomicrobium sp. GJ21]CEJ83657.1 (Protein-PII) uridylyltransferase (PII uridylyl-transferase) (Uridylyl-removing enzyme) (UTase) [Hyphomicrobium sp. GJ21]